MTPRETPERPPLEELRDHPGMSAISLKRINYALHLEDRIASLKAQLAEAGAYIEELENYPIFTTLGTITVKEGLALRARMKKSIALNGANNGGEDG